MTLFNYDSTFYFTIMMKTNSSLENDINQFIESYSSQAKLLCKYILTLMYGSLYDNGVPKYPDDKPPLIDVVDPVTEPDPERVGKMYHDLYNEFLKLNIINAEAKIPDYIMIKYGALIDDNTQILKIDANQKMLNWMPLDANNSFDYNENTRKILDLYYQLLDEFDATYIFQPNDVPDEIYEKYKELFDNDVLILQIPNIPQI